ncbi:hypothetical protein ElyMa_003392700 [Elysia marginata]|uniref:CUB domain-containing protein n=1 Tax=Elysia marginata TaxID=1093978 RepID=A0AAV4JLI5_9GAST|nr:hypothetical protein ElyMa_003392700 [Elysia marginata]
MTVKKMFRRRSVTLQVLGLSLCLLSLCRCQGYFDNPRINFGDFFHVSFPNGSTDLLYECLCDINIIHCSLTYVLQDGLNNRFGFPYYYTITTITQTQSLLGQPSEKQYTNTLLCDALNHSPQDSLNCRRLAVDDNTCATSPYGCLSYSVQQDDGTCFSTCALLVWHAEFTLDILYINFGSLSAPVKDGVCHDSGVSPSTPRSLINTTDTSILTNATIPNYPHGNITDNLEGNGTEEYMSGGERNISRSSGVEFSTTLISVLVGAGCITIGGASVIIVCIAVRKRGKDKQITPSASESPSPSCFLGSQADSTPVETSETSNEEMEVVKYHTLDEMANANEQETAFVEFDDQGYEVVRDDDTRDLHHSVARDESRSCRPLPEPPNSAEDTLYPTALLEGTPRSFITNSLLATLPSTTDNMFVSRSSTPRDQNPSGSKITAVSTSNEEGTIASNRSDIRPAPRPHICFSELEDHTYLGLVDLTPDQNLFGHMTEMKLVRAPQGHLQLVSVQGELPACTDYYTRILLFKQEDDMLGVVGLLGKTFLIENEHSCIDVPRHSKENRLPSEDSPSVSQDAEVKTPDDLANPIPDIIYFGSLKSDLYTNFEPCDYLTALDTERSRKSSQSDDYLTVLDVDSDG